MGFQFCGLRWLLVMKIPYESNGLWGIMPWKSRNCEKPQNQLALSLPAILIASHIIGIAVSNKNSIN